MSINTNLKKPRDVIGPLLVNDEKIIWCGRPEPEKDEMRLTIIETVTITIIAIIMASGIAVRCNGWLVLAFCGAAILHTLYMIIWGTLLPQRRNKIFENIVYGITDNRLLICAENGAKVRECQFSNMSEPEIIEKRGIIGTIIFDDSKNDDKNIKKTDLFRRNCIKNVDSVDVVIQDLKRCMSKDIKFTPNEKKAAKQTKRNRKSSKK